MKLLSKINEKLNKQTFASVEICLRNDGEPLFHLLTMSLKANRLVIEDKASGIREEELLKQLKKNTPIVLTLTGKGVLSRELEAVEPDADLVKRLLPNAASTDFHVQAYTREDGHTYCAMVRADLVEKALMPFTGAGLFVVALNVGAIPRQYVQEQLTGEVGMELEAEQQGCFAALLQYVVAGEAGVDMPATKKQRLSFGYYNKFKKGGMAVLGVAFVLLLVNYFIFDHYYGKANALRTEITQYASTLKKRNDLQQAFDRKTESLKTLGIGSLKFSYTTDELLYRMPTTVRLDGFAMQPPMNNREKIPVFEQQVIRIKGKTPQATDLNQWLEIIKQTPWVETASLGDYHYVEREGTATFEMVINLKRQ